MPLLIISRISSEKSKYLEAVKFMLKNSNIILSNKYCQLFPLKCQAYLMCFQENVYKMSTKVWVIIAHLSAVILIKHGVQWRTWRGQLLGQSHEAFSFETCAMLRCVTKVFNGDLPCHPTGSRKARTLKVDWPRQWRPGLLGSPPQAWEATGSTVTLALGFLLEAPT